VICLKIFKTGEGKLRKYLWTAVLTLVFLCPNTAILADEGKYRIGPGDVLEISVWKDESLFREISVPPDGVISYPLIGDIIGAGETVTALREAITEKLSEYVPDATVTVILKQVNSLQAYVIGKVNNPGVFPITMDTTVMQVLAMAQGLNPFASAGNIHILRRRQNVTVRIPFNYKEVEKGENYEQNIILQRGDVVVVP
jgi:polysaccharide export outer membrane protein